MIASTQRATTNLRYHQNPVLIPTHYGLTVFNVHTNSVLEAHVSKNVDDQSQGCNAVPLPTPALWPDPVFVAPVVSLQTTMAAVVAATRAASRMKSAVKLEAVR
jgi:hypothetical protein